MKFIKLGKIYLISGYFNILKPKKSCMILDLISKG